MLLGSNHTQQENIDLVDVGMMPFPRQRSPPERTFQLGSGFNKLDKAAFVFFQCQTHRKPGGGGDDRGLHRGFTSIRLYSLPRAGVSLKAGVTKQIEPKPKVPKELRSPKECTRDASTRGGFSALHHLLR